MEELRIVPDGSAREGVFGKFKQTSSDVTTSLLLSVSGLLSLASNAVYQS